MTTEEDEANQKRSFWICFKKHKNKEKTKRSIKNKSKNEDAYDTDEQANNSA